MIEANAILLSLEDKRMKESPDLYGIPERSVVNNQLRDVEMGVHMPS